MPQPLLSICIPTYNRADCLRQCLASITDQFKDPRVKDRVEIVVSDNGSADQTAAVLKQFEQFGNITILRNLENIGFDRNVLQVVAAAKGRFCWLLGDDDALFDDALPHVLGLIEKSGCSYFLLNCWGYDHELNFPALSQPNLHLSENKRFATLRELVCDIGNYDDMTGYFGGMSCQLFDRRVWRDYDQKEKYIGTQAIHLFVILAAFRQLPSLEAAKPVLKVRADNLRWDTFPGLESISKRVRQTQDTLLWLLELYRIPYSAWKVRFKFFRSWAAQALVAGIKKYLLRNERLRKFVTKQAKKILGK